MSELRIKMPPRFIQDCLDCDCKVGVYSNGILTCSPEQLAELKNRADHYADEWGPDVDDGGALKRAAMAALKALNRAALEGEVQL